MVDYQIQRVSDATLIRLSKALVRATSDGSATFNVLGDVNIQINRQTLQDDEGLSIFNSSTFFLQYGKITVESAGFSLEYKRGLVYGMQSNGYPNWHTPSSPFIDGIRIDGPKGTSRKDILNILSKELNMGPPGGTLDKASAQAGDAMLNRLNEAILAAVDHTIQRQVDLDNYRKELESSKEESISIELQKFEKERNSKIKNLDERERDLEARLQSIDDRSNTHVRRSLQNSMAQISEDTLSKRLLKQSESSFMLPLILAFLVIAIMSVIIYREINNIDNLSKSIVATISNAGIPDARKPDLISSINNSIIFGQLRIALQAAGVGLITWFALSMARQRYKQTSRWEHDLHRFRLDTERASFLIEGELEARRLNGMVLPEVVLDRFSRGLFSNGSEDRNGDTTDIGNTLAHLLNRPSKLRIGPNGIEAEVDRKELRQTGKEISSGE